MPDVLADVARLLFDRLRTEVLPTLFDVQWPFTDRQLLARAINRVDTTYVSGVCILLILLSEGELQRLCFINTR
jgi:hypothetical protein